MESSATPRLSVVIPAFNEEEGVAVALRRVVAALEPLGSPTQIVVVDDGSTDRTAAVVETAIAEQPSAGPEIVLVQLSRNFGHQNAITAGLAHAGGDFVGVIDADLQDPPELLLDFLAKAEEGFDVVYGIRRRRHKGVFKRLLYWIYYRLLRMMSEQPVPLDAGDFCVMSARVVDALNAMPERVRYLRGLRHWVGFRQVGVEYERPGRAAGRSKYGYRQLFRLAGMGFVSSTRLPLQLASYLGMLLAALGFVWAGWILYARLFRGEAPQGFAATMVAVLCLGGAQLVAVGVLGQYLGRVLDQVEGRPHYVVSRVVQSGAELGQGVQSP